MTLRTLSYGNYGIFLIMGNAGFCPSAVRPGLQPLPHGDGGPGPPAAARKPGEGALGADFKALGLEMFGV